MLQSGCKKGDAVAPGKSRKGAVHGGTGERAVNFWRLNRWIHTCARSGDPMNHSEIVSFLWGVADLIRDTFRRGRYQDVILPLTVLRRLDCVLAPTKEPVLARQAGLRDRGLGQLQDQLPRTPRFPFYNTPRY